MMRNRELMIYRGFPDHRDGLLHRMALLMDAFEMGEGHSRERFYGCIHSLLELAGTYGFHGNLWHCYLTHLLVIHENSYSRGCEMRGGLEGTVNQAVLHDMEIFKEFFDYDFAPMCALMGMEAFSMIERYEGSALESWRRSWGKRLRR